MRNIFRRSKQQQSKQVEPPVKAVVCDDIEKITYASFIKCAVNNDFSSLVISGNPSEREIFIAWITILSKHYELLGSKDALKYVQLVCRMERHNVRIQVVSAIIEAIRIDYNEKFVQALKDWGFNKTFSPETLEADLEYVDKQLQTDNYNIEKAKLEFDKQEKESQRSGKNTKEMYMRTFYAVVDFMNKGGGGRSIRPEDITLYEVDVRCNEMVEYNEQIKKAYGKQ